jgi:hypothetical protein
VLDVDDLLQALGDRRTHLEGSDLRSRQLVLPVQPRRNLRRRAVFQPAVRVVHGCSEKRVAHVVNARRRIQVAVATRWSMGRRRLGRGRLERLRARRRARTEKSGRAVRAATDRDASHEQREQGVAHDAA